MLGLIEPLIFLDVLLGAIDDGSFGSLLACANMGVALLFGHGTL